MEHLTNLIDEYGELDAKIKDLDKRKKKLNADIKDAMASNNLKDFESSRFKAIYGTQDRSSIQQEKLLRMLQEGGYTQAIIKIESPDVEKVKELIQTGQMDPTYLVDCVEEKIITTLTVRKVKGDK